MNISELNESKYLTQHDLDNGGKGMLLTITKTNMEDVARQNEPPEKKLILYFAELEKGAVLGSKINREAIAAICGSGDTEHWVGHKIVGYRDLNVMYMGAIKGGIRFRAPVGRAAAQAPGRAAAPVRPAPVAPPLEEDDIPF